MENNVYLLSICNIFPLSLSLSLIALSLSLPYLSLYLYLSLSPISLGCSYVDYGVAPYQALCVLAFTWKKRASELISRNH